LICGTHPLRHSYPARPRCARCSFSPPLFPSSHTECASRVHTYERNACVCVRARVFFSFPPSYGRGSETAPLPCASRRLVRGVTASFGWVRAKETDENRAGMHETRSRERTGGVEEEFVKSLPRSLHPVISRQLAPPYSYYGSYGQSLRLIEIFCAYRSRSTRRSTTNLSRQPLNRRSEMI